MQQPDVDRLLRRRLYLQRYITSLVNDVSQANREADRQLIAMLGEFVADADDRTLAALARHRTSNAGARELLAGMRRIVREQRQVARDIVSSEMALLVEREAAVTSGALGESDVPSTRGVATLPVSGAPVPEIIGAAFALYATRLLSEVTRAAATEPDGIVRIIRGSRAERFRDGLLRWRDDRLIRPNIDVIVNGTAANAARHVYTANAIEMVEHVATLDFRTCPRCVTAEQNGPYPVDQAPPLPIHVRCRCVNLPSIEGLTNVRPYVRDHRSVKDIPVSERDGKIGQTRKPIEEFFDRMTKAQRRQYMGRTRAALWEAGKIDSVKDLVDQRTLRPLRLDELPDL